MSPERPYDRNDNDTYVEVFSLDPATDAEAHMFGNPKGRVVGAGNIRGDFSTESAIKASNSVLHFPSARDAGLINLGKSPKLSTPLPMSLVKRYKRKAEHLFHAQPTPVFFDSKTERFVVLLDKRFLRDISPFELGILGQDYNGKFAVYASPKAKGEDSPTPYLGLLYDSIEAVRQGGEGSALALLMAAYKRYNLQIEDGEKVILLKVCGDQSAQSMLVTGYQPGRVLSQIIKHQFRFEFAAAFRFGDVCYLQTPEGEIDQSSNFILQKQKQQGVSSTYLGLAGIDDTSLLLVLPYSDEQFALLSRIHTRMAELAKDIMSLVEMHQNPQADFDNPINPGAGSLGWIGSLLLERDGQM